MVNFVMNLYNIIDDQFLKMFQRYVGYFKRSARKNVLSLSYLSWRHSNVTHESYPLTHDFHSAFLGLNASRHIKFAESIYDKQGHSSIPKTEFPRLIIYGGHFYCTGQTNFYGYNAYTRPIVKGCIAQVENLKVNPV